MVQHRGEVRMIRRRRKLGRPAKTAKQKAIEEKEAPPKRLRKSRGGAKSALRVRRSAGIFKGASGKGSFQKVEGDYRNLAESRGFKWVADAIPHNTLHLTTWECKNGHRFKARWADIYWGRGCGICSGRSNRTERDYIRLADRMGLKFIGPVPRTTRGETLWEAESGERITSTYQKLRQKFQRSEDGVSERAMQQAVLVSDG